MSLFVQRQQRGIEAEFEDILLNDPLGHGAELNEEAIEDIFRVIELADREINHGFAERDYIFDHGRAAFDSDKGGDKISISMATEFKPFRLCHELGHSAYHSEIREKVPESDPEPIRTSYSEAFAELTAYHLFDQVEMDYSESIPERNPYTNPDQTRFYAELVEEDIPDWKEHHENSDLQVDLQHHSANLIGRKMSEKGLNPNNALDSTQQFFSLVRQGLEAVVEHGTELYRQGELEQIYPQGKERYEERLDQIIENNF
ncbi:MAG: hypothetical protein H8Z69_04020 [Nanohaloarchaea archaeon]|nr:hypothetical protein [Candidatus Nanohaloarchaea archaeon]